MTAFREISPGQWHYERAEKMLDFADDALGRHRFLLATLRTLQAVAHAVLANATATAWPGR